MQDISFDSLTVVLGHRVRGAARARVRAAAACPGGGGGDRARHRRRPAGARLGPGRRPRGDALGRSGWRSCCSSADSRSISTVLRGRVLRLPRSASASRLVLAVVAGVALDAAGSRAKPAARGGHPDRHLAGPGAPGPHGGRASDDSLRAARVRGRHARQPGVGAPPPGALRDVPACAGTGVVIGLLVVRVCLHSSTGRCWGHWTRCRRAAPGDVAPVHRGCHRDRAVPRRHHSGDRGRLRERGTGLRVGVPDGRELTLRAMLASAQPDLREVEVLGDVERDVHLVPSSPGASSGMGFCSLAGLRPPR